MIFKSKEWKTNWMWSWNFGCREWRHPVACQLPPVNERPAACQQKKSPENSFNYWNQLKTVPVLFGAFFQVLKKKIISKLNELTLNRLEQLLPFAGHLTSSEYQLTVMLCTGNFRRQLFKLVGTSDRGGCPLPVPTVITREGWKDSSAFRNRTTWNNGRPLFFLLTITTDGCAIK